MRKMLNKFSGILFGILMFLSSFMGTIFLLMPTLPLVFFSLQNFYLISNFFITSWLNFSSFLIEDLCRINILAFTKNDNIINKNSNSLIIMNHRTRLDWLFFFCVLKRINCLKNIKILLKRDLRYIPGPGWAMQFALFIFLNRKWHDDSIEISKFIDFYKVLGKNFWILIFPEGTNFTYNTKSKSDTFASKNNLEKYKHLLVPRHKGLVHLYKEMKRNHIIDTIIDVTVSYENIIENESDFLYGKFPKTINFHINIIDCKGEVSDINEKWIYKQWAVKDSILNQFERKSCIQTSEKFHQISKSSTSILNAITWILIIFFTIYLIYNFLLIKLYVLFVIILFIILEKFLGGIDNVIIKYGKTLKKKINRIK